MQGVMEGRPGFERYILRLIDVAAQSFDEVDTGMAVGMQHSAVLALGAIALRGSLATKQLIADMMGRRIQETKGTSMMRIMELNTEEAHDNMMDLGCDEGVVDDMDCMVQAINLICLALLQHSPGATGEGATLLEFDQNTDIRGQKPSRKKKKRKPLQGIKGSTDPILYSLLRLLNDDANGTKGEILAQLDADQSSEYGTKDPYHCLGCGMMIPTRVKNAPRCGRCRAAFFCSKNCQKQSHSAHESFCKAYAAEALSAKPATSPSS